MQAIKVIVVVPHKRSRYYRLRWRIGRKVHEKSSGEDNEKSAIKVAAQWEADLNAGRAISTARISWDDFCTRYQQEHLSGLAKKTADLWHTARRRLEAELAPAWLDDIDSGAASSFRGQLAKAEVEESTIATYLRTIRAAVNWAQSVNLLAAKLNVSMPRGLKRGSQMRGRPVTELELANILKATPDVRPDDTALWQRFIKGLYLSGLRLDEGLRISWDHSTPFSIDLTGARPMFRIWSEGEKGRQDRTLPLVPEFADFILTTKRKKGSVFGITMTMPRASKVISAIGEAAQVEVNSDTGKWASAHDLRRSFGTRWASLVMPAELQRLMRHESIETTMKYYVGRSAEDLAESLWNRHRKVR